MDVKTIGIDLAKSVFQVHGVDAQGNVVMRKKLKRDQVAEFFVNLPRCLIGMEACGGAHYWARRLQAQGHDVRLIPPQFVKPYVKAMKNDQADAEAICEAVGRPSMRFVAIKTVTQQAVLSLHRARQGMVKARTATGNQLRGLLAEFGLVVPVGLSSLMRCVPAILAATNNELPDVMRQLLGQQLAHLRELDETVKKLERDIQSLHRHDPLSQRIGQQAGIGPLTASALVASVGNAGHFRDGRQLAASIGLVPRQHSSGGKACLMGISKRGDSYLRTLLIHGARSVIKVAGQQPHRYPWLTRLIARRGKNVAAVALANKNVRIAWALMRHPERAYIPPTFA